MAQRLVRSIKQGTTTTAHLVHTMALIAAPTLELEQKIESEIASNPALEVPEPRICPTCKRKLPQGVSCPICSRSTQLGEEPVVFVSVREDIQSFGDRPVDDMPEDAYSSAGEDLPTYVLLQVAQDLGPGDQKLAAYLLTNLDENGLLTIPLIEAARYFHIPISRVEEIQHIIQRADPLGVCSLGTQQALRVQLEVLSESHTVPYAAIKILETDGNLFARRQVAELARVCQVSQHQVQEALRFIGENLNPYPARSHWGDFRQPSHDPVEVYHKPDIIIGHVNDDPQNALVVEILLPLCGLVQVNPMFKEAVRTANEKDKENWKEDLERATLFIKCLQQRNHTMKRLMTKVAVLQREFITKGEKYLKSVTRAQISKELEVHESTISRAVSGKTVQLPDRRIVPLAEFFDRSLNVRTVLREMVEVESHPLSDLELVELLHKEGYDIARRTVAKYRSMEGILPAHLRRIAV